MRTLILLAVLALLAAGCRSEPTSPKPTAESQPPASSSPVTGSSPASASPGSPSPSATLPSPAPIVAGSVVRVNYDAVQLNEGPEPESDPAGSLPVGSMAYVATAISAGGTTSLQLLPLDPGLGPTAGWAPIAETGPPDVGGVDDDPPQLEIVEYGCDSIGVDVDLIVALSPGEALACYSRPFTFAARIVDCNCDMDGGIINPSWFGIDTYTNPATGQPTTPILVEESATEPPEDTTQWLLLHLDPAAESPDPLPFGAVVEFTAQFDHPAAASCTVPQDVEAGIPGDPVLYCRTRLAVTGILMIGP